ncbi:C2H2 domain-containing protein [Apiospora arundinis]|uniref:C2H2 domain-containing protein n=1 Tax=Apiospora arundinis TaxID=335852 RepID=A0ABR2ISE2_9PEZI
MASSMQQAPQNAFEKALEAFQSRLKPSEKAQFKATTLDELKATILSLQADQRARKQMRNMTKIRGFLEAMEQFGKVVEVFLNITDMLAFIWGPIKLLLLTASTWADSLDILLDAYQSISDNLPLFEAYQSIFSSNQGMQTVLVCAWSNIFDFHIRALRIFEKSLLQTFFRSLWKDFNAKFQHILNDLKRLKELVRDSADQLHIQHYEADRLRLLDEIEQAQKSRSVERQVFVTKWIEAPETDSDHEHFQSVREEERKATRREMGQWILDHSDVADWLAPQQIPKASALWINAVPGAGKSVLASVIIDEIRQRPLTTVAYAYCKHKDYTKNTFISIAKTLLVQLLHRHNHLVPFYYDSALGSGEVSLHTLKLAKRLLQSLLQAIPSSFLIIDGLDECEVAQRKLTLDFFNEIVNTCDITDPGKLRLLILSRNEPDIRKSLALSTVIRVDGNDTIGDMKVYIGHRASNIQAKFSLTLEDRVYIERNVEDRSDGMFLYAKLVLSHLEAQPSLHHLQEQYHRFPRGLEEAYSRNLERIRDNPNESERGAAQKLLSMMLCSRRPLRWRELQAAMSIDMAEQVFDKTRMLVTRLEDICGSLVEVLPGDRFEFVHVTASWYITNLGYISIDLAERWMTTLCLNYLTFECFGEEAGHEQLVDFLKGGDFGFQDYAIYHWPDHAIASMQSSGCISSDSVVEKDDKFTMSIALFDDRFDQDLAWSSGTEASNERSNNPETTRILNHAIWFKALTDDRRDKVSLASLSKVLKEVRQAQERLHESLQHGPQKASMCSLYGDKWFKCNRLSCHYFHEGFVSGAERQAHYDRHDRPFKCDEEDCPAAGIGLSSLKELEKHKRNMHPGLDKLSSMFARLKKREGRFILNLKHPCPRCPERFPSRLECRVHMKCHNRALRPKGETESLEEKNSA